MNKAKYRIMAGLMSLVFVTGCEGADRDKNNGTTQSLGYLEPVSEDDIDDEEFTEEIKAQPKGFDGRHRENLVQEENYISEMGLEPFNKLYADMDFTAFELVYGSEFGIEIYNYKSQTMDAPVGYSISKGKLTIEQENNRISPASGVNYVSGKNCKQQRVIVTIPDNHKLEELSVKGHSDVAISNLTAEYLYTDISYGEFRADDCKIENAEINLSYTKGSMNNLEADDCDITAVFSQLELYNNTIHYYDSIKIDSSYSDLVLNGYNTPEMFFEIEYGNAKINNSIFDTCKLIMSFSEIEIEGAYAKELLCVGVYGGLKMENWESDGINITSQYTNISINGDLKGTNSFYTSFGDLQLKLNHPIKNYMIDIKMLFADILVNGESQGSTYKKMDPSVEHSISISGGYNDVTVDFTE